MRTEVPAVIGFEIICLKPNPSSRLYAGAAWKKEPYLDQVVAYADSTYYGIIRVKPCMLYVCLLYGTLARARRGRYIMRWC